MKIATFRASGVTSWGVVVDAGIADVGSILIDRYSSLKSVIEAGAWGDVREAISRAPTHLLSDVAWLPTLTDPGKILCIGLNYETHRKETGRDETRHPAVFTRFADTQIGHLAPIIRPRVSTVLDYEGELAIIIGKHGRYIAPEEAMDYVAGYSCYNDATIRDWQRHTIQFTPGKNFPGTGALGPMVTADEIDDYRQLSIETRVNGVSVQSARLDQLIFDIPTLIAYCSSFTPLAPGDIIATGTPGGVGFKRDPQLLLAPGDVVEVEISKVGLLRNGVEDEA